MKQTFEQAARAYFDAEMELNTAIRFGTDTQYERAYAWYKATERQAWALAPDCAKCGGQVNPIRMQCDCYI